ncbi:MAG: hypothetical protein ACXVRY_15305 [Gaiellaceae bacterium]
MLDVLEPSSVGEKDAGPTERNARVGADLVEIERFCDRQRLACKFNDGFEVTPGGRSVPCHRRQDARSRSRRRPLMEEP